MQPVNEEKIKTELYTLVAVIAVIIAIAIIVLAYFYFILLAPHPSAITPTSNINKPVMVPTFLNSSFLNNTIPSNMLPGKSYTVTIIAKNTGDVPWSNNVIFMAPYSNDTIEKNSFSSKTAISSLKAIKQNGQYTWSFSMTAPTWNGNYTVAYQMRNNTTGFGDILVKNITVGTPGANVAFPTLSLPATMKVNTRVNVTVIVKNMGRDPWYEDDGVQLNINYSPNDGSIFTQKVRLQMNPDSGVMPGDTCKWVFPITAPSYATQYNVTFQMMQGNNSFGAPATRLVKITK